MDMNDFDKHVVYDYNDLNRLEENNNDNCYSHGCDSDCNCQYDDGCDNCDGCDS